MAAKRTGEEREQPLVVHTEDFGDRWCCMTLRGVFDLASCALVTREVNGALGRGRDHVVVDAADVTFIDSSALMVLLKARNELSAGGGSLQLSAASPPVRRILEITVLTDVLLADSSDDSSVDWAPPLN